MKRSERLAHLKASLRKILPGELGTIAEKLLQEEEAAFGLKWDSEEPLPQRLASIDAIDCTNAYKRHLVPETGDGWVDEEHQRRGYNEAARRYNAWPEVRRLATEGLARTPVYRDQAMRDMLAIIDGKEGNHAAS